MGCHRLRGVPSGFELAMELVDLAAGMAMDRFKAADLGVQRKADGSPVTDADRDIERALRERLSAERPSHAITGEEFGESGESELRWYLDPIVCLDYSPMTLIGEEAGGTFTDFRGRPGFDQREALVSNGLLHAEALCVLGDDAYAS